MRTETIDSREKYVALFSSLGEAIEFETLVLSSGDEFLPPCARRVLGQRGDEDFEPSPEYWAFLASQMTYNPNR